MGTLGNKPATAFQELKKQSIIGNAGTTYALDHAVTNANDLEVFVNNVRQEPTTAYTISGQNIVMSQAIANTDSFYLIYQSRSFTKAVPADASITQAMLQPGVGGGDVVDDTTPQLGGNLDGNGFTINLSGGTAEPTASFSHGSTGYTQGSIALKSDTTSSPKNRGQGIYLFNEENDTTWYVGTPYDTSSAGSRPFDFGFKSSTTSLDAETAATGNTKTRIHASGKISAPAGIELGSGLDGTAANTLDAYEEGTFTATLVGYHGSPSAPGGGPLTSTGHYTKIGNRVNFILNFENVDTTGGASHMWVTGFPFATYGPYSICPTQMNYAGTFPNSAPFGIMSGNILYFYKHENNSIATAVFHNAGTGRTIRSNGTYRVS